jgi:hypothetical protein
VNLTLSFQNSDDFVVPVIAGNKTFPYGPGYVTLLGRGIVRLQQENRVLQEQLRKKATRTKQSPKTQFLSNGTTSSNTAILGVIEVRFDSAAKQIHKQNEFPAFPC